MMSSLKDSLPVMLSLARENTDLSRLQLAGMLSDVFLRTDAALSLREEELVNELIDQLMASDTPGVRAQLIEKFADAARMPRRIATTLANEEISVARAVLTTCSSLADEDLVSIVHDRGSDHAQAIAQRMKISEAVADALVVTGDLRVIQLVAENLGAQLSASAIDMVSTAARYCAPLRRPLMERPEMTAPAAIKMYWWIEQDLRRYTLKRFGFSSGQIDQALADTLTAFLKDHSFDKSNDSVMDQVADWMSEHQAITPSVLPQVLRMGHYRLFNILLARLASLSLSLIDTIMEEAGGRGLAAVCRAIDVDKSGFVSLFLLSRGGRPGDQIVHPRELSYALAAFDRLSPAIAVDLLHSWSVNPEYFAKHSAETEADKQSVYA